MRSKKKYTNLNFTKRVDHEAGHVSKKHPKEPAVCKKCGAIYTKGRWSFDDSALKKNSFGKAVPYKMTCPACIQIKEGIPAGFVYIKGRFFEEHKKEIVNLLRNEEERLAHTNPLARIMNLENSKKGFTITTTTEHLAQHLGRALHRAYGGQVEYDFSHENKLARVYWERDD